MDLISGARVRPLLFDGGLGSELMRCGLAPGECPESWTMTHPEVIEAIHHAYFAAGSDIVNTNTFGGSRLKLAAYGLAEEAACVNEAAARIAVAVRDREFPGRMVAGNIGPSGQLLAPLGMADPDEVADAFAEQALALVRGGADLLNIETMYDLSEASLAVEAACRAAGSLPVLVSLAFRPSKRGYRTMMGADPAASVSSLREAGAAMVGCNCEVTAEEMADLVPVLAELNGGFTYAQPNAGQPRLEDGATVYDETPHHFAAIVKGFATAGAVIVGGCCGTTPDFIAALAGALDEFPRLLPHEGSERRSRGYPSGGVS